MASGTVSQLLHQLIPATDVAHAKVSIVGVGQVGMACAFSMLLQDVCSELCLVDMVEDKLKGEMMDLQHGLAFVKNCKIQASTNYNITANSVVCIITAGARQREGESRLDLVQRNVQILKGIVPQLVKHSPKTAMIIVSNPGIVPQLVQHSPRTCLIIVSNPVDILTYVTYKLSGLPRERIFGTGTNLDSARFRFLMSQQMNIAPSSCHGWIIGEHGDSSVPVWSGVNVAGVQLKALNMQMGDENDPEKWREVHRQVVNSAYDVIKLKGYTSWAIGLSCSAIVRGLIRNTRNVFALSISVKGLHGIEDDVYLSLPCVLGEGGVTHIIKQPLGPGEKAQLLQSAKMLADVQSKLEL